MLWATHRTVVLEKRTQEFVDEVHLLAPRFDDQWRGVEWLLARTPQVGTPRLTDKQEEYLICVFPRNNLAGTNELWVLYSYDKDQVVIHAAHFNVEED